MAKKPKDFNDEEVVIAPIKAVEDDFNPIQFEPIVSPVEPKLFAEYLGKGEGETLKALKRVGYKFIDVKKNVGDWHITGVNADSKILIVLHNGTVTDISVI
jgi:hypothetical protein